MSCFVICVQTRVAMRTGLKGYHPENEQVSRPFAPRMTQL